MDSKKKFMIPSLQQFLARKIIYDEKKDPVWVTIEKDMIEQAKKGIKPYNETVGTWLRFLRDMKCYFYRQSKSIEQKLIKEIGPPWYYELSVSQRHVLSDLKDHIHKDIIEDLPHRTRKALSDLGITLKIPRSILLKAMKNSMEDPGVFMWDLYETVYKQPPSKLRGNYDMNAIIMMSCLVFIDLDECIERLSDLLKKDVKPEPKPIPKKKLYYEPKCRYGAYLQKMHLSLVCSHGDGKEKKKKPRPLDYRIRLKSETSYENLYNNTVFLDKRRERNRKAAKKEVVCRYKFWEPPTSVRNTDPKKAAYATLLKLLKLKAKVKFKTHFENAPYHIAGVSYIRGRPQYIVSSVVLLTTEYTHINGGIITVQGENVNHILGHYGFPKTEKKKCSSRCDCLLKWEDIVMKYIQESKCTCGHLYDFHHAGTSKEKYFYPPSKNGPYWFDEAKVYQLDPMEDFIKDAVRHAVRSEGTTPEPSITDMSASGIKIKDLLKAFLADLSDTPLLIPHLPKAYDLNNLQEWVRNRVHGKITPKQHVKNKLHSLRNWVNLDHMDFRARAYRIPFTQNELQHLTWSHRYMIQDMFHVLMEDFVSRNRLNQLHQTRIWWPTMYYDAYPNEQFLNAFFTYMPGRMKDSFLINPYSSQQTPTYGSKTCPIGIVTFS